jgi:hypothetical protein
MRNLSLEANFQTAWITWPLFTANIILCFNKTRCLPILVDSDTRVPSDCLLDACSEMEASPEVGIMQFSSGVMQVVNTYFENG